MNAAIRKIHFCLLLAFALAIQHGAVRADNLVDVHLAMGDKAISPVLISRVIPTYLGYYKEEGLNVDLIPAGSNSAVMAGLNAGRFEFGAGQAADQLPQIAKGVTYPAVDYFETTYPFKYGIAIKPGSNIKTLSDLKGKRIGVSSFGNTEYNVGRALLGLVGLDGDKDVSWLAVGEGVTSGLALQRGDIDALVYFDTGFGQIESAGVKLDYLTLPPNTPKIGGSFLTATPAVLRDHRDWAVGVARAILKAEVFIQENPEAAAYIFLKMYPEAAPKGLPLEQQVQRVLVPTVKRMPLYTPYGKDAKWGAIEPSEWQDEIAFYKLQGKIKDVSSLYTNDLVADINNFDWAAVRKQAHDFKLPYSD